MKQKTIAIRNYGQRSSKTVFTYNVATNVRNCAFTILLSLFSIIFTRYFTLFHSFPCLVSVFQLFNFSFFVFAIIQFSFVKDHIHLRQTACSFFEPSKCWILCLPLTVFVFLLFLFLTSCLQFLLLSYLAQHK